MNTIDHQPRVEAGHAFKVYISPIRGTAAIQETTDELWAETADEPGGIPGKSLRPRRAAMVAGADFKPAKAGAEQHSDQLSDHLSYDSFR